MCMKGNDYGKKKHSEHDDHNDERRMQRAQVD